MDFNLPEELQMLKTRCASLSTGTDSGRDAHDREYGLEADIRERLRED